MTDPTGGEPWSELVRRLFREACRRTDVDRVDYLERECGEDQLLRQEVEALLASDPGAEWHFSPSTEVRPKAADDSPRPDGIPTQIGRYEILDLLGEGGMGVVYRARQTHPAREVALKVLRPGLSSPDLLRRFQRETQILGRLTHPGVARIYDAGFSESSGVLQPWFAMELVSGEPIHRYASRHNLTIAQRLDLMARVADAVDHAHQQGVIHRDLKPGNLMVTEEGEPRVLDFGVARLAQEGDELGTTWITLVGEVVGTLPYMSPEQASGRPGAIDEKSDVYALGVITFELLAGQLPIDVRRLPVAQAAREIAERDPPRLGSLKSELRGDVEIIVGTALEKDSSRRYSSAAAFAVDLRRHLRDEPIEARPPSWAYRLTKLTRRHRVAVFSAAMVLLTLIAATAVSVWFALASREAERIAAEQRDELAQTNVDLESARREAEREAGRATVMNEFLLRILDSADPFGATDLRGPDTTLGEVLDSAARWVGGTFVNQASVESAARVAIANSYKGIGRYDEAAQQLEAALAILTKDASQPESAKTNDLGPYDEIMIRRELASLLAYQGKTEDSIERLQELVAQQQAAGDDEVDVAKTRADLGWALMRVGRNAEAEEEIVAADLVMRARLAPGHEITVGNASNLSVLLLRRGDTEQARRLLEQVRTSYETRYGPIHPNVALIASNQARICSLEGDRDGAVEGYRDAIRIFSASLSRPHHRLADLWNNLGFALHENKELEASEKAYRESLRIYAETLGEEDREYVGTLHNLAFLLRDLERYEEADEAFRVFGEYMRVHHGEHYWRTVLTRMQRAECWWRMGRVDEAEQELLGCYARLAASEGETSPYTRRVATALAKFYRAQQRDAEAIPFDRLAEAPSD